MSIVQSFKQMISNLNESGREIEVLVPAGDSSSALKGLSAFIESVTLPVKSLLIGNAPLIEKTIKDKKLSLLYPGKKVEIVSAGDTDDIFQKTADLIDKDKNQIILKGNTTSDQLMKGLLKEKEKFTAKGGIITHLRIFETPDGLHAMTDGGINVVSNVANDEKKNKLLAKVRQNGLAVLNRLGYAEKDLFDAGEAAGSGVGYGELLSDYTKKNTLPRLIIFPWIGPANIIYKAVEWPISSMDHIAAYEFGDTGSLAHFKFRENGKSFIVAVPGLHSGIERKKELLQRIIETWRKIGTGSPGIALLDFTEQYESFMDVPSVRESRSLVKAYSGNRDCILEGPMAYDLAISGEAARIKGYDSKIAGEADVLYCPDYLSGVLLDLVFSHWDNFGMPWSAADISFGGAVPILVPSRSDSSDHKLRSIIAAAFVCQHDVD